MDVAGGGGGGRCLLFVNTQGHGLGGLAFQWGGRVLWRVRACVRGGQWLCCAVLACWAVGRVAVLCVMRKPVDYMQVSSRNHSPIPIPIPIPFPVPVPSAGQVITQQNRTEQNALCCAYDVPSLPQSSCIPIATAFPRPLLYKNRFISSSIDSNRHTHLHALPNDTSAFTAFAYKSPPRPLLSLPLLSRPFSHLTTTLLAPFRTPVPATGRLTACIPAPTMP